MFTHLRIARPVTNLERSFMMYSKGLQLHKQGEFTDHQGFNGIMLGRVDLPWHLEFTHCPSHPVVPTPTLDDLLVLYFPLREAWEDATENMVSAGFSVVSAFNPYWDVKGITFIDDDGYRVVLHNTGWETR